MRIANLRVLDGPNVYLHRPVMVVDLDLGTMSGVESCDLRGLSDCLLSLLPGLHEHGCAKGIPGGFVERLRGGTYFGHIVEHVAIELAQRAGLPVTFGKTVSTNHPSVYQIAIECPAEAPMRYL